MNEDAEHGRLAQGERQAAADAAEQELILLFRRARSLFTTLAARVHPELDAGSYGLLLVVAEAGSIRGMDVADRVGLDKSTVSRQIATLVEYSLLDRVPDPDDGRARLIQLSEEGWSRLRAAREQRRAQLHEQFGNWTTDDLRSFARLLAQFNGTL